MRLLDKIRPADTASPPDSTPLTQLLGDYATMCGRIAVMNAFKGAVNKCIDDRISSCVAHVKEENKFTVVQVLAAHYGTKKESCAAATKTREKCDADNDNDPTSAAARNRSCTVKPDDSLCDSTKERSKLPQFNVARATWVKEAKPNTLRAVYCCHPGPCGDNERLTGESEPGDNLTLKCPLKAETHCHQGRRADCEADLSAYLHVGPQDIPIDGPGKRALPESQRDLQAKE